MKTRHLQITIGAYTLGGWNVAIVQDLYERGVKVDSQLIWGPMYCDLAHLQDYVHACVEELIELERERLKEEGGPDQAERTRPLRVSQ